MGDDGRGWDDWGRMHDGIGWGGWLLMGLLLLLLVALVVGLVVMLLVRPAGGRTSGTSNTSPAGPGAAEQVLSERFARGEIDEEEYLRRRSVLRGG